MRVGWMVSVGLLLGAAPVGAQPQDTRNAPVPAAQMSGYAGHSLAGGQSAEAAVLANQAIVADANNPWAHYRRAGALSDLQRTDEAVAEFKVAEQLFGNSDERGRAIALYGRANALARADRCAEANPLFEQYAQLVEKKDAKSAAEARQCAHDCHVK